MRRLLGSTTALSMAMFNVQPWPLMAQTLNEDGYVVAADGTVLCEPTAEAACDPADPEIVAKAQAIEAAMAEAKAQADADAAAQAQAEADAAAKAQADADATAQAQAEADAAAKAQADADAAAQAQAEADAAAKAQADADAAAQAQAEADAAAKAQADADAAAQAQADADAAAQAQAEADAAAQTQADADAAAKAQADADATAQAQADADAAAKAQADADAAAQAQADADAAAKAQADADATAQAQADADAAAKAQADADAAAQAQADADAAAKAQADAVTDQPAADETAPADQATTEAPTADETVDQPATDEAVPGDEATTEPPASDEAAPADATADQPTVDETAPADEATAEAPATDETAAADQTAEQPATDEAAPADATNPDAAATETPAAETVVDPDTGETLVVDPSTGAAITTEEAAAQQAAQAESLAAAQTELAVQPDGTMVDPSKGLATAEPVVDPNAEPVDAPVPTDTEVQTLSDLMATPDGIEPSQLGAAETLLAEPVPEGKKPSELAPAPEAVATVTQMLTDADTRASTQEFAAAPVAVAGGKKDRLSDLEKVGLVALGALVVGTIINQNNKAEQRQVVSNTGDRVVVLRPNGTYQVYKDDDAVIRRPGSNVRTETYNDGSTRTIIERGDGTQIVTIRDATGRVLRRAQYDDLGRELVLIDDLEPEEAVIVTKLPKPHHKHVVISTQDDDSELRAAIAAKDIADLGRKFSLRQIREIPEVRALAATIDVDSITFDSGSAAIKASEASDLADLGALMQRLIKKNPAEMFLIEGHTDATGKAAMNLALSDRRAESVALALTEYFEIPPENMVIQGYGETELRIDTQKDEKRNRRVAVRIITPLLKTAR